MLEQRYQEIVKKNTPKEDRMKNAIIVFVAGGLFGLVGQLLLEGYKILFNIPSKEAGILVILTVIIISSVLTAVGVFDVFVTKIKSALIIPISGFAHSITSAALDYRKEGLVLGIGSNIFKLAGTVILYGVVAVYLFGLIRLVLVEL